MHGKLRKDADSLTSVGRELEIGDVTAKKTLSWILTYPQGGDTEWGLH